MKKYIFIKADTNDGDYISKLTEIKNWDEFQQFLPLIATIKNCKKSHNWETGDNSDTELNEQYPEFDLNLLENFDYYVPSGEYGVHTIEEIKILEVNNEINLL